MSNHTRIVFAAGIAVALLAALAVSMASAERSADDGEMGFVTPPAFGPWAAPNADEGWGDTEEQAASAPPAAPVADTAPFFPHGWDRMWGWRSPTDPNGPSAPTAQEISIDGAIAAVQQYLRAYNNPDLVLAAVKEFSNNFYAVIEEKSAGKGAFELLVDRYTGNVRPELGPNATWNIKYVGAALAPALSGKPEASSRSDARAGRGRGWSQQPGVVTVTPEQARASAQRYLAANLPGAKLIYEGISFPGYYTFNFLRAGKTAGTLSVNGYTGQVWYHTWHGEFIQEREL